MFSSAMTLMRDVTAFWTCRGGAGILWSTPSMRWRITNSFSKGSRWTSEARFFTASRMIRFTYLTIRLSSTSAVESFVRSAWSFTSSMSSSVMPSSSSWTDSTPP